MRKILFRRAIPILTALSLAAAWSARPRQVAAENAPPPLASYKVDVQLRLDENQCPKRLEGREQLTWRNDSPDVISDLQFHLYLNAFKNEKSTFFRESGGQLRGDRFEAGQWGWIDVVEMKIAGGEDLTGKIEFIHPDDDNADDRTVIRVPLSRSIKPGETLTLDIKFAAELPRVFARTGYWGPFALVAQWFPKIGVWEQAGERRRAVAGWNCHQFHANSEFYADFGNYDVMLRVPAVYKGKIGATGAMRSERDDADGTVTYHFAQENVHDFAWTVDRNYAVETRRFNAGEQVKQSEIDEWSKRLNLPADQIRLKDVDVTLLIQRENRAQADRHFAAAFNAIKYYGLWYGKYPYDTLTVVDPPYNADGAGGMEYPTFITAGTSWWPGRDQNPEAVIVHEFGHQFWYGLVASNEFEESWLDEGFNTYSEKKVLKTAYGADSLPFRFGGIPFFSLPIDVRHPYEDRIFTLQGQFSDPILTPAWKYLDSTSYGLSSYPRTGLALATLERHLGEDLMARVMREYHQRWRYRHPASQDFFDTVNAITGQDFTWFFDQFVKGTNTLDYEIVEMRSARPGVKSGVFESDGKKTEIKEPAKQDGDKSAAYDNEVVVRRLGEAWFPIEMDFRFKDGSHVSAKPVSVQDGAIEYQFAGDGKEWTESWAIHDRWKKFRFASASELTAAQLDPEEKVLLEACFTNNSKTRAAGAGGAMRWATGAMFWVQAFLQFVSALG